MTTKVTKESLAENIGRLESYGDLSINEEYQLKAYRMLLAKTSLCSNCNHETTTEDIEYGQCGFCGNDL
jgi:ATP adenylyltransferase/5',5'''-P-1,P-4-tetraphosphate phosphorylase II